MKLYGYFRSSAAYRVRIALAMKGLSYDHVGVHMLKNGGEQHLPAYRAINPQGRVPSLELDDGTIITQSPAILEYLEEAHPDPALLPSDPIARAHCRSVAAIVACDIHPLNNLAVLGYLKSEFGQDQAAVDTWYAHWIMEGFNAIEPLICDETTYCFGDRPGMADLYLVPQVYNARRFNVPLNAFPKIVAVDAACAELDPFQDAHPDAQPDAA